MKLNFLKTLTCTVFLAGTTMVNSAVIYDPNTSFALGVSDFEFGGSSYDVHFLSGSYSDVYGPFSVPLFLDNPTDALAANLELVDILNGEPVTPVIGAGESEVLWIVRARNESSFTASQFAHNALDEPWSTFSSGFFDANTDYSDAPDTWLFAKFEDTGTLVAPDLISPVPLPASGLFLMGGLFGMIGTKWRSKRLRNIRGS